MIPTLRERSDRPLPRGGVPAGSAPVVAVAAHPPHPSNAVLLLTRRGGAPAQPTHAIAETAPPGEPVQCFRGSLPSLVPGEGVDYRLELMRGGQPVATLPADGSWLQVRAEPVAPAPSKVGSAAAAAAEPASGCAMEFFARFAATGRLEPIGETPEGFRINFLVDAGRVTGPGVDAVIEPGGGDWLCVRTDGVAVLDIRATFRTTDGALTFYRAPGVLDLGPDGHARAMAGRLGGAPTFHAAPTFLTADARWQWLNRVQGFGVGRAGLDEARVDYDVYLPRAANRPGHA